MPDKDPLRIGFDAKRAFYNRRGLGNYSRDTIRILTEQKPDAEYYLFTPKTKNSIPLILRPNTKIITPSGVFYQNFSSLWRSYGQKKEIKREKLDIYHGLSHELPVGIEKEKVRTVLTMHDVIFLKNPELFPLIDRYTFRKKYVRSSHTADRIIAISEETKRDLIKYIGIEAEKIDVVYQGCSPIYKQKITDEIKKEVRAKYNLPSAYMLTVGAIERRKNHEVILKAMHMEKDSLPLVIVGQPSVYKNDLLRLISEYSLGEKVFFLENVETEDLPALYQSAAIFVYPSLFEGFGIPILEALTSGTPVITSRGSCFKETGGNAAYYIDPNNPEELSSIISLITGSVEIREHMIEEGYRHALLFSDENIADSLMKVYQKVLR